MENLIRALGAAVALGALLLSACTVEEVAGPPAPNPDQTNPPPAQSIVALEVRNKPEEIPGDGLSQMLITITVQTDNGLPAIGAYPITVQTTNAETALLDPVSGVLSNSQVVTTLFAGSLQAFVYLIAPPREGNTRINAWVGLPGGLTDSIQVHFTRPKDEIRITLTAEADTTGVPPVGARFSLRARVTNLAGAPLIHVPVAFSIEQGAGYFELPDRDFTEADGVAKTEVKITSLIALLKAEHGNAVATVVVQVGNDQSQFPTACFVFAPEEPVVDEPVTFNAQCSDDLDGTVVSYIWNFGDGTASVTTSNFTITHTFTEVGTYTVRLEVVDNNGLISAPIERQIQIGANQPPNCTFSVSPSNPTLDDTVFFDASGTRDPDGSIVRYEWNFGDGTSAVTTTPTVSHVYTRKGTYTVRLEAFDNDGDSCTATRTVTFANTAPTAVLVLNPSSISDANPYPQTVGLDGSGSSDPDGDELRYCPAVASVFDPDGLATLANLQFDFVGGSADSTQQVLIFDPGNRLDGDETITFRLTVTDQTNLTSCDAIGTVNSKDSDEAVLQVLP